LIVGVEIRCNETPNTIDRKDIANRLKATRF